MICKENAKLFTYHLNRPTATKYLDELSEAGFLHKTKQGWTDYYIHASLLELLTKEE